MSKSSEMKSSTLARDLCQVFSVFFAILVRLVLAAFCVATVMVVVDKRGDNRYWTLTITLLLMVIEGAYTIKTRKGRERRWICLCFGCYLLACVPSIWLLELEKLGKFKSKLANTNTTSVQASLPGGFSTSFELDSDEIISILENCLVFLLILCRWLLPSGEITRDQLSQLLFVFIGMASDVMELFQLFEEDKVQNDKYFVYVILTVWSVSLCQFTLVLTMSASPEKARAAGTTEFDGGTAEEAVGNGKEAAEKRRKKTLKQFVIQTEIWSLFVSIVMQDGPFLAVRLYAVFELGVINSTIVFFVLKNVIVVMLLAYRLVVVGLLLNEEGDKDSDDIKKFKPLKEVTVVAPIIKGKSGSYKVKQISEDPDLPGISMESPNESEDLQSDSSTAVIPRAAPHPTTPTKSARRKLGSRKVSPASLSESTNKTAQLESTEQKSSSASLDTGMKKADPAEGSVTENLPKKEQALTLSEVEPSEEISGTAQPVPSATLETKPSDEASEKPQPSTSPKSDKPQPSTSSKSDKPQPSTSSKSDKPQPSTSPKSDIKPAGDVTSNVKESDKAKAAHLLASGGDKSEKVLAKSMSLTLTGAVSSDEESV